MLACGGLEVGSRDWQTVLVTALPLRKAESRCSALLLDSPLADGGRSLSGSQLPVLRRRPAPPTDLPQATALFALPVSCILYMPIRQTRHATEHTPALTFPQSEAVQREKGMRLFMHFPLQSLSLLRGAGGTTWRRRLFFHLVIWRIEAPWPTQLPLCAGAHRVAL